MKKFLKTWCPAGMIIFTILSALQFIVLLVDTTPSGNPGQSLLANLNPLWLWIPTIIFFILSMIEQINPLDTH